MMNILVDDRMPEPLKGKRHSFVHCNKYKLIATGKKEKIGETNIYRFKIEDVKSAVELLDEQLNSLCCDPSLTYDDFMERKKRILMYCFTDVRE